MSKTLGRSFGEELVAAGLGGTPLVWRPDGTLDGRDALTAKQQKVLDGVIAAHDPDAWDKRSAALAADRDLKELRKKLSASPAEIDAWIAKSDPRAILKSIVKYLVPR
jgi:hypothetical protein